MPRNELSLESKIAFLDKIKYEPHKNTRWLSQITGLTKSTIARILKNENALREEWASQIGRKGTSRRRRFSKYPDIDIKLNQWYTIAIQPGKKISEKIIKDKAEEIAKELGYKEFTANSGWLWRWKQRNNIKKPETVCIKSLLLIQ